MVEGNGNAISETKILIAFKHNTDTNQDGWYVVEESEGGTFRFERVLIPIIGYSSISFGNTKYPDNNAKIILITEYGANQATDEENCTRGILDRG